MKRARDSASGAAHGLRSFATAGLSSICRSLLARVDPAEGDAAERERRRAHEELRAADERCRMATRYANITVCTMDHDLRYTWVPGAHPGSGAAPAVGARDAEIFPPEEASALTALKREVLRTGVGGTRELRTHRGGREQLQEVVVEPLRDDRGGVIGLTVATIDVTARRAKEARWASTCEDQGKLAGERTARNDAERAKNAALATISHELRAPLTAILGWTQMLQKGDLGADNVARGLEVVERNARAQAELIEELMDVSRIDAGKVELAVGDVALEAVLDDVLSSTRPVAEAKGVALERGVRARGCVVRADAGRVRQVVSNLVANAIKFTPQGGHVRLGLQRAGHFAELQVSDSGRGISPELLPHVFSRFRQGEGLTPRCRGGLGLGLAIVKHLVELQGGAVRAASEGEGKGATFTVVLPLSHARGHGLE